MEERMAEGDECVVDITEGTSAYHYHEQVQSTSIMLQTKLCNALLRALGNEVIQKLSVSLRTSKLRVWETTSS